MYPIAIPNDHRQRVWLLHKGLFEQGLEKFSKDWVLFSEIMLSPDRHFTSQSRPFPKKPVWVLVKEPFESFQPRLTDSKANVPDCFWLCSKGNDWVVLYNNDTVSTLNDAEIEGFNKYVQWIFSDSSSVGLDVGFYVGCVLPKKPFLYCGLNSQFPINELGLIQSIFDGISYHDTFRKTILDKVQTQDLTNVELVKWRALRCAAVVTLKAKEFTWSAHHMAGGGEDAREQRECYYEYYVLESLREDQLWKEFSAKYFYNNVSGAISRWQQPPIRALIQDCNGTTGTEGHDLTAMTQVFVSQCQSAGLRISVINSISSAHDYLWFNGPALLRGIELFVKNNNSDRVEFLLSFSEWKDDQIEGLLVQIFQIDPTASPRDVRLITDSRYGYNKYFPMGRDGKWHNLEECIRYWCGAGVKLLFYRAFEPLEEIYKGIAVRLELGANGVPQTKPSPLLSITPLMVSSLALFVPAETVTGFRDKQVWLVDNKAEGGSSNYKYLTEYFSGAQDNHY